MRLQGKTLLITAAGQGIGRASALACAREGAHVIATDIDARLLDSLGSESATVETRVLDVRSSAAVTALAAVLPPLDGVFNCAGHVHEGTMLDCDETAFDFSYDLNVKGAYRVTRAFVPGMLEKMRRDGSSGSIVNMASMASSVKGFPNRFAYGVTKAAVVGMSKAVAADYARLGLRCNALCPGTVDTPSLRQRIAASSDPVQAERDFVARQPMGRLATVEDIAPQVVFLLSDESRFVTGQTILVDGGVTI